MPDEALHTWEWQSREVTTEGADTCRVLMSCVQRGPRPFYSFQEILKVNDTSSFQSLLKHDFERLLWVGHLACHCHRGSDSHYGI